MPLVNSWSKCLQPYKHKYRMQEYRMQEGQIDTNIAPNVTTKQLK